LTYNYSGDLTTAQSTTIRIDRVPVVKLRLAGRQPNPISAEDDSRLGEHPERSSVYADLLSFLKKFDLHGVTDARIEPAVIHDLEICIDGAFTGECLIVWVRCKLDVLLSHTAPSWDESDLIFSLIWAHGSVELNDRGPPRYLKVESLTDLIG